jgi:hypothetical protein
MNFVDEIYNSFSKYKRESNYSFSPIDYYQFKQEILDNPNDHWDYNKFCELPYSDLVKLFAELKNKEIKQSDKKDWNLFLSYILDDCEEINDNQYQKLLCTIYECEKHIKVELTVFQKILNWFKNL